MGSGVNRVIALAGPSGVGKTRAAHRSGLPRFSTDAFFRDADDPRVPRRHGVADWEDIRSYDLDLASTTLRATLLGDRPAIPFYSYAEDRRIGWAPGVDLVGTVLLVEGTFAFEVSAPLIPELEVTKVGLIGGIVTCAWSRVVRDLRESRQGIVSAVVDSVRHAKKHRERVAAVRAHADLLARRADIDSVLSTLTPAHDQPAGDSRLPPQ